jgi:hypothetical protein
MGADDSVWAPVLLGDPLPPRLRLRSPQEEAIVTAQTNLWLKEGVVEAAPAGPLTNNLVLVAKGDGGTRVCIDCTPVNKVTQDFDWPLPMLQDLRHRVRGFTWFGKLDLRAAFFRVRVPRRFRNLLRYINQGQHYWFTRMPFGAKTAPAIFQRFMDNRLARFHGWAFWYIDDILIMGNSPSEVSHRMDVLRRHFKHHGQEIHEGKSVGPTQGLLFAGTWITSRGTGPNLRKLSEAISVPAPRTKSEAQSALGLVSYLRDFIPLVSHYTAQLYPDKQGLRLGPTEYQSQWDKLCRHLTSAATTLRHWKEGAPGDLYTDASGTALGAILIQERKVVALASRKLTPAETRYSATDREHLGLVFAAKKFKLIIQSKQATTTVHTDHEPLLDRKVEELSPRQARWLTITRDLIPNLRHVRGKDNPADYVSRWGLEIFGGAVQV